MKEEHRCRTISDFSNIKGNEDTDVWRIKYEALLKDYEKIRAKNADMEDRFLHIVEKVEGEKQQLAEEIDHLVHRVEKLTERNRKLEEDCKRYKSDCATAVRLLRNQQGEYDEEAEPTKMEDRNVESPTRPTFVEDNSRTTLFGFSGVFII
uniref:t-SNARE coiled-coil homology domain-containing protein n=1 Tax=Steinernema glaseri TaxID=37863 RepID=A0A1I7YFS4_9BILA